MFNIKIMKRKVKDGTHRTSLGRSKLQVPRMGVGAMTWGDPKGLARLHPAKTAYGGAHGIEEERHAVDVSIEAGVNLFDTAAMYSGGAAERRLGELARGKDVLIATKFPAAFPSKRKICRKNWRLSLTRLGRDFNRTVPASLTPMRGFRSQS